MKKTDPNAGHFGNLLRDNIIRVRGQRGEIRSVTLPELLALLMSDEVESLPALRPHQKQALHCFLAQVGAMALLAGGESEPPQDADRWAELLRGLTPGFDNDEPWCLVVGDWSKPAFMQAPVPDGSWTTKQSIEHAPDSIDILMTSKNHDVKGARVMAADADNWLFALLTFQTLDGYGGRSPPTEFFWGISRMNGSHGSRPFVGAVPENGGWGKHLARDIRVLTGHRKRLIEDNVLHRNKGGIGLVWLESWDGETSLETKQLDPYYVEICRRIRLRREGGHIIACRGASKRRRINQPKTKYEGKEHTLPTDDPWAPIERESSKPLTIDGLGFSYKRVVRLLDPRKYDAAPLQLRFEGEVNSETSLLFITTVRGQNKTDGYHERRVLLPLDVIDVLSHDPSQTRLSDLANERVADVAKISGNKKALEHALFGLFQIKHKSKEIDFGDPKAKKKAEIFIARFERTVDADFFERLFEELPESPGSEASKAHRRRWLLDLEARARNALAAAEAGSPLSGVRRYRARAAAESLLVGEIRNAFPDLLKVEARS